MADLDTPRLSGKKTYFRIDDDTVGAYAEKWPGFSEPAAISCGKLCS